jgi:hypothetical protein
MHRDDRKYWLDDPANVTKLYRGLWVAGILLAALDLVLNRHDDFSFAETWGYYAFYGFVACVALVLAAKEVLRRLLKRPENYYER